MKISHLTVAVLITCGASILTAIAPQSAHGDPPATAPAARPADAKAMRLIHALANDNRELALELIAQGADVNATDKGGSPPLYYACSSSPVVDGPEKIEIAKILIARGANVNGRCIGGFTPLHEACDSGNSAVVELLLSNGADVNARDNYGNTPMHIFAYGNCHQPAKVLDLLLQHGADINPIDKKGRTPLDMAEEWRRKKFAEHGDLLLAKGAKRKSELGPAATQKARCFEITSFG